MYTFIRHTNETTPFFIKRYNRIGSEIDFTSYTNVAYIRDADTQGILVTGSVSYESSAKRAAGEYYFQPLSTAFISGSAMYTLEFKETSGSVVSYYPKDQTIFIKVI
jgi:hypothetical protein